MVFLLYVRLSSHHLHLVVVFYIVKWNVVSGFNEFLIVHLP